MRGPVEVSRSHALALLALLALFWGLNWPIMKIGLSEIPPWVFRALAGGVGGIGLLILARVNRQPLGIPRHEVPRLALAATLNITLWNMLILYGIDMMSSGRAAILAYTMPIWASLLGIVVLGEKLTRRSVIALALGLLAVALLFLGGEPGAGQGMLGPLLVVLGAVCWGAGTVAVKYFRFSMSVTVTTAWQHLIGTLPIALVAAAWDVHNIREVTLIPALCVAYNMTVTAIFCYWAYFKVVASLPIAACTLGTLMVPVLGVLFSALVFRVPPAPQDYVALAAVVAAVFLVLAPARTRAA